MSIAQKNVGFLVYGIREIVEVAHAIKKLDPTIELTWENIGDPVAKGWPVPPFLKEILATEIARPDNRSFAYTHSRGNPETRAWAAGYSKKWCPSSKLTADDILFTNGLGSAISMIYQMIATGKRVLQPSPTYPTHASFESFCAGSKPIFYKLDPDNNWEPDIASIESALKEHPEVIGITIINPNNPTGAAYSKETLAKIVDIAERNKLMIISDEIYFRMVYPGTTHVQMTELASGRVPLLVMRGLSKDVPWPGGRCGWLEFHNVDINPEFKTYADGLKQRVLPEVCAGTLQQQVLPQIYDHPDFPAWNANYSKELKIVADDIASILSTVPELQVNKTHGAFYMVPRFKTGSLTATQSLPIANPAVKTYIEKLVNPPAGGPALPLDKRFTYYLLAATGIVCVPASDFFSPYHGFRITTLERDPAKRKKTYEKFTSAVRAYLGSG